MKDIFSTLHHRALRFQQPLPVANNAQYAFSCDSANCSDISKNLSTQLVTKTSPFTLNAFRQQTKNKITSKTSVIQANFESSVFVKYVSLV